MCIYKRKWHFSALIMLLFLCSLSVHARQVHNYALRADQQMVNSIALRDAESGEFAGTLELGVSLTPGPDTTTLHLSFYLPYGLERSYNSVFLFDQNYTALDIIISRINQSSPDVNYRIHRNAPESIYGFVKSAVEMKPKQPFGYYQRFSDTLSLSMVIPHAEYTYPNDFGMVLQLYHMGRRRYFRGAFEPISINISHRKEKDVIQPDPEPEVTSVTQAPKAVQETPSDAPPPAEEDDRSSIREVDRQTAITDAARHGSITRDDAFARTGMADRTKQMKIAKAESLENEAREIYRAVITKDTQIEHHVDDETLSVLKSHADYLTQANIRFDEMIEDGLSKVPGFESFHSNFLAYYEAAGEIINKLAGEETVLPLRQEQVSERRDGIGWQRLLIIIIAAFLLLGGIIYFMKWQKKVRQIRLDKKIKRQANMELNKQKHMMKHKPKKQVKI